MSDPRRPYQLESPVLRRHGLAVARYCFEKCYETWPELDRQFGERGRHHTAEDNFWHLDYLDSAIAAGVPETFVEYTDWLVGLLTARGLTREQIAGAYEFLAEALERAGCPSSQHDHRRALVDLLRRGRDRARVPAPQAPGTSSDEGRSP